MIEDIVIGFIQPSATETFSLLPLSHNFVIMEIALKEYFRIEMIEIIRNESNDLIPRKKNNKYALSIH